MKQEFDSAETDRLLEALYGDASDDGSATAAIEQLSASESADLESLRSVRAMFADMADVDPPVEMNAGLLAAAAKAVAPAAVAQEAPRRSTRSYEDGLWGRILNWFQPLVAHPGLAAAASLALVATIGGVLYMNNRGDLAEPAVSDEASDLAKASSIEAPATKSPAAEASQDQNRAFADAEEPADAEDMKAGQIAKPTPELKRPLKSAKSEPRKPASRRDRDATKIRTKESKFGEKDFVGGLEASPRGPPTTSGKGGSQAETKADESLPLPTQAFEQGESADDAPAQTPSGTANSGVEQEKKSSELATIKRQAAAAAERGDCVRARSLGAKVQKIDRRYFTGVFKTDRDIRDCYAPKKKK